MTAANLGPLEAAQPTENPLPVCIGNGCQQCTQRSSERHLLDGNGNCSLPRCSYLNSHWLAWTRVFLAHTEMIYGEVVNVLDPP